MEKTHLNISVHRYGINSCYVYDALYVHKVKDKISIKVIVNNDSALQITQINQIFI